MGLMTRILSSELFMTVAMVAVPWMVARAFAWWRGEVERLDDERYSACIGGVVEVPLTGRTVPVVADEFVDPLGVEHNHPL